MKRSRNESAHAGIAFSEFARGLRDLAKREHAGSISHDVFVNLYSKAVSDFVEKYGPDLIVGKRRELNRRGLSRGSKQFPKHGTKSLRSRLSGLIRQSGAPPLQGGRPWSGKR
jgi:hypothetical protein